MYLIHAFEEKKYRWQRCWVTLMRYGQFYASQAIDMSTDSHPATR